MLACAAAVHSSGAGRVSGDCACWDSSKLLHVLSNTALSAANTLSVGVAIGDVGEVVLLLLSLGVVNVSVEMVYVVVVEGVVSAMLVSLTVLVVERVVGVAVGVGGWSLFAGLCLHFP